MFSMSFKNFFTVLISIYLVYDDNFYRMVDNQTIFIFSIFLPLSFVNSLTIDDFISCNSQQLLQYDKNYFISYPEPNLKSPICSYLVKSPPGTFISAVIYHNISGYEPLCKIQRIRVSRSGDNLMRDVSNYCGLRIKNPLKIKSIGNEMAFEMVSQTISGYFRITLNYIRISENNCDCR